MTSSTRLRLQLGPSRRLATAIVCLHATAGLCAGLPWAGPALAAAIFLMFLLFGALVSWRIALLRAGRSPARIELAPDGGLMLELQDGTVVPGRPGPRHVTRHWVALRCGNAPGGAILVVADMLPADAFRRLRLWALWSGASATGNAAPA